MLIKDFYQVKKIEKHSENEFDAFIRLNSNHEIFKGHFPGNPVVPGVCMIQIVKEIISSVLGWNLSLKTSKNIKFMALINPEKNPDLKLYISCVKEGEELKVKNISSFGTTNAVKMSLNYNIIPS